MSSQNYLSDSTYDLNTNQGFAGASRNIASAPLSFAPNMISDFFGSGDSTTLRVFASPLYGFGDLNGPEPAAGVFTPLTVMGPTISGMVFVTDNIGGPSTIDESFVVASSSFTSIDDQDTLRTRFLMNDNTFEIENNPAIQAFVQQVGEQEFGSGEAVFRDADTTFQGVVDGMLADNLYEPIWNYSYYQFYNLPGGNLASAPGASIGRMKIAENTSPIPRDRVFVNYSYFDNTPLAAGGVNVNRVTPGFEKTFFDGNWSFELRTPFASTLDSNIIGGVTNTGETEFGNMTMYLKALLYNDEEWAFSAGLGVTAPTADDVRLRTADGTTLLQVSNESVHLLPFVGGVYAPNDRFFAQGFMQLDIDSSGNPVSVTRLNDQLLPSGQLVEIDRPHDFVFMYLDFNIGYWMFLDQSSDAFITGMAPMVEIHHNQTISGVGSTNGVVDNVDWNFASPNSISTTNVVLGLTSVIKNDATLTLGYVTPLSSNDAQFDGELRLTFNWFFGGSKPTGRFNRVSGL